MNSTLKNLMFWLVSALVIFLFWSVSSRIQKNERLLSFSDFLEQVEAGHVSAVSLTGGEIVGDLKNGQSFRTYVPRQAESLIGLLREHDVEIYARDPNSSSWLGHLISWTPIVIMIAFLIFFMRQMQRPTDAGVGAKEQRAELKLRLLYSIAASGRALSEQELTNEIVEPASPQAAVWRRAIRSSLYEMLAEGTVALTPEKKFRARDIAPND